jgi:hypothetical protein
MNQYLPMTVNQGLPAPGVQTAGTVPFPNVNGATAVLTFYPGHPALHGNIATVAQPLHPGQPAPGMVGSNAAVFRQPPFNQGQAPWVPMQGQVPQAVGAGPLPPVAGPAINQGMSLVPGNPGIGGSMQITTFAHFYADKTKDPYQRRYDRIMARFDADLPTVLPSKTIFQQVVSVRATVPQAYLFCADTTLGPRVYCTHFPRNT